MSHTLKKTGRTKNRIPIADVEAIPASSDRPWYYRPQVIQDETQRRTIFDLCRNNVDPIRKRIKSFGGHDEPRLTRLFARKVHHYEYSGITLSVNLWLTEAAIIEEEEALRKSEEDRAKSQGSLSPWTDKQIEEDARRRESFEQTKAMSRMLTDLSARATATLPEPYKGTVFDTALINFYENGKDYVSWHSDNDAHKQPIASFSLGAIRPFAFRRKTTVAGNGANPEKPIHINMEDGSMLVMLPPCQSLLLHSLLQRSLTTVPGMRINITFRCHEE